MNEEDAPKITYSVIDALSTSLEAALKKRMFLPDSPIIHVYFKTQLGGAICDLVVSIDFNIPLTRREPLQYHMSYLNSGQVLIFLQSSDEGYTDKIPFYKKYLNLPLSLKAAEIYDQIRLNTNGK